MYTFGKGILVNYTKKGKQAMVLDIGASVSLPGREWIVQYLKEKGLKIKDKKLFDKY